jgi:23S rRNA (cytosine1962-C5)-methyltransferase
MSHWNKLRNHLKKNAIPVDRTCAKLFNGPAGEIPGLEQLHIDRFGDHIFVLTYLELLPEDQVQLIEMLTELYPGSSIRIQQRESGDFRELYLSEGAEHDFLVEEGGLSFKVHTGRGQNTGFFADMREGRRCVRELCDSKRASGIPDLKVLNLFAYTCSFSVSCLAGGAARVDNWDMNKNSLSIGRENHRLNGLDERRASYFGYDIFKSFSKIIRRGPYDLVILDPPPRQGRSFSWEKDYPRLMQRLPRILNEGASVLFCLNAPDCGRQEFLDLIKKLTPGDFASYREIPCPPEYLGRYPDRGLKTFLADDYKGPPGEA